MEKEEVLSVLRALSCDTRLEIFEMLRGKQLCGYQILDKLKITEPTLSHHLRILTDAGLIKSERDWKWIYYSINEDNYKEFLSYMKSLDIRRRKKI